VLGLVGEELYLELFEILARRDQAAIFRFVQRVIDEGYDLAEFYKGLADALRAFMVAKLEGAQAAEVREDLRQAYADIAQHFAQGDLLRMLSMVAELDTEGRFRKSTNPRTMLEALLLRWAFMEQTVDLESLLRAAGGQAAPPLAPRAAPTPRAAETPRTAEAPRPSAPPAQQPQPDASGVRAILRELEAANAAPPRAPAKSEAAPAETPAPARITPERVRAEKLAALTRDDEALDVAVKDWDLELFD
jgi:DNA polymerase-3 subunit gamma/tau